MSDTADEPRQIPVEQDSAPAIADDAPRSEAQVPDPDATATRRSRRGALVAGAISLPLVTVGLLCLALPLAVWYVGTVLRTVVVVIIDATLGRIQAADANETLAAVDPGSLSVLTLTVAIVGAVLFFAGAGTSVVILRAHGVARPALVTLMATPLGVLVAWILAASIGALGGLLFQTADSVGDVLGKAAIGIALTVIGSALTTVATGAVAWLWVARLLAARSSSGG